MVVHLGIDESQHLSGIGRRFVQMINGIGFSKPSADFDAKSIAFFGTRYVFFFVHRFQKVKSQASMFPGIQPLHSVIDPAKPKDAACPAQPCFASQSRYQVRDQ